MLKVFNSMVPCASTVQLIVCLVLKIYVRCVKRDIFQTTMECVFNPANSLVSSVKTINQPIAQVVILVLR